VEALNPYLTFGVTVVIMLAVVDLWVGVTNDAANFLNSAIGARVATRRTILIIASIGVIFGALVSSGMMEVARKGVFNPDLFLTSAGNLRLEAVLAVYLGVMVADVILLDLFNSFGLPTSTTVSIVSELVGASIAVNLWANRTDLLSAFEVVNTGPVLGIYTGIFLSIVVAFTLGAIIMGLLRVVFTRDLSRTFARFGWLWSGAAFTILSYFVIVKGLKSASFLAADGFVYQHLWWIVGLTAALVSIPLARRRHDLVLKGLILAGTGALAIAFAGNDLVNFIGPSVAAAQAVFVEGIQLSGKVPTPHWALLIAGVIMAASLWISKKARTVQDTEVRLASQAGHAQRFRAAPLARMLVRIVSGAWKVLRFFVPASLRQGWEKRTRQEPASSESAAYDLLRASANLTIASMLISIGTANKLPLSTTYITFTVAMGTALGDRVWGRENADARVTGMLTVFGGWLLTGLLAATGAFVAASVIYLVAENGEIGKLAALGLMIMAVILAMTRLASSHRTRFGARKTVVDEV
jgi:phosphate/sulfate permease